MEYEPFEVLKQILFFFTAFRKHHSFPDIKSGSLHIYRHVKEGPAKFVSARSIMPLTTLFLTGECWEVFSTPLLKYSFVGSSEQEIYLNSDFFYLLRSLHAAGAVRGHASPLPTSFEAGNEKIDDYWLGHTSKKSEFCILRLFYFLLTHSLPLSSL